MRLGPLGFEVLLAHIVAKRCAARDHRLGDFAVAPRARMLKRDLAVMLQVQPIETVNNGRDRRVGGPRPVGVFDPQQIFAAHFAGEQPIEEGRPRPANMKVRPWARGQSG